MHGRHRLVFTNTTPTTAYRGAGRPNVAYLWERLVEEAARAIGIDSVELRRRNLLRKDMFPLKTPTGSTYDSADPARLLDTALQASDWDGFEPRRKAAKRAGKLRGIGLAMFLEPSGGMGKEQVELRVEPDGRLSMFSLAGPSGQGHETVYPALVARHPGRSRGQDRPALQRCRRAEARRRRHIRIALADQPRRRARDRRQGDRREGPQARRPRVRGRSRRRRLRQGPVPRRRHRPVRRHAGADRTEMGRGRAIRSTPMSTLDLATAFPSGAHVAEVEIDPDTGAVAHRELCRGRRLRHDLQSHAGRGPAARRADAGHRPGVRRAHRLRSRDRPAAVRQLHGLLHAAGGGPVRRSR